jgi:hypothetical protein
VYTTDHRELRATLTADGAFAVAAGRREWLDATAANDTLVCHVGAVVVPEDACIDHEDARGLLRDVFGRRMDPSVSGTPRR